MKREIAAFKNRLTHVLKRLFGAGETNTVHHNRALVARLVPLGDAESAADSAWAEERAALHSRALRKGGKVRLSALEPPRMKDVAPVPRPAPDGRTDVQTVAELRKEKPY